MMLDTRCRMLDFRGAAIKIFFLLFLTGIWNLGSSINSFAAGKVTAVIVNFQGSLLVKTNGTSRFAPAKKGQFLYEGDIVKTEKNSLGAITFVSGVSLKMNANTEFTISVKQLGKADEELTMGSGQVYSKVLKRGSRFGIKTPVALAAVRGTEFDVQLDKDGNNQRLSVMEGVVQLGNDYGLVNVNAGQYALCAGGESPQPPQDMGPGDKPVWQEKVKVDDKDQKEMTKKLQEGTTAAATTTGTSNEKTLKMQVDTPDGKKTLNLKFKKESQ